MRFTPRRTGSSRGRAQKIICFQTSCRPHGRDDLVLAKEIKSILFQFPAPRHAYILPWGQSLWKDWLLPKRNPRPVFTLKCFNYFWISDDLGGPFPSPYPDGTGVKLRLNPLRLSKSQKGGNFSLKLPLQAQVMQSMPHIHHCVQLGAQPCSSWGQRCQSVIPCGHCFPLWYPALGLPRWC